MKKDKTTLTIPNDNPFGRNGHTQYRSGAGKHLDKRTRRKRTRGAALRTMLQSY